MTLSTLTSERTNAHPPLKGGTNLSRVRYYSNPSVRSRIEEFLGFANRRDKHPSCFFMAIGDSEKTQYLNRFAKRWLPSRANDLLEISRSLWDRESLLADLDIEYVNFDFPAESFLRPERTFFLQEPVRLAGETVFADLGINPLHLVSGRGHHFIWQISRKSLTFERLVAIGRPFYDRCDWHKSIAPTEQIQVGADLAAAYCGLGLLMEFLAHQIKAKASSSSQIPVEITAIEVVPGERGREMVSLDISEYGDPLYMRMVRAPFSRYLKPIQQRSSLGAETVDNLPSIFEIPAVGDLSATLTAMRDVKRVIALASETSVRIPDRSAASADLIKLYQSSFLARFHELFCSTQLPTQSKLPVHGSQTSCVDLPPCVRYILEHPNDLLLKPAGVRRLTITMLALGWHPSQIADLIHARFREDHHWNDIFSGYDPRFRADFYTRLFAGLVWLKLDSAIDFSCWSSQKQGWCFHQACNDLLEHYQQSLINRRFYGRLANRPFHRLFFPKTN